MIKNKNVREISTVVRTGLISLVLIGIWVILGTILIFYSPPDRYVYVGKIIDMEGGSSGNLIILTLDTIGKTPYTFQHYCSNRIRVGQKVYKRDNSDYLFVEYKKGMYC
jgi:hypothetical protein